MQTERLFVGAFLKDFYPFFENIYVVPAILVSYVIHSKLTA